ncbi:hypothetical protein L9F63_013447, partial [Diploptera punctata]
SDIVHQSVYELVHSEDREELQRQLMWNSFLPPESANIVLQDVLQPENCHLLERSFTVRFRCLLDNTSGFLRLDIRGRIKVLHGQNRKTEEPPLALFAICTPFGPPSLLEIPQKEVMFKSKHKLDLTLVSMDQRGKMLLGYSDAELANLGGYDLVHYDDLAYVASAHQELLKTGASGMIAYRYQTKEGPMAMAADKFETCIQEFQTRFCHQHASTAHGGRRSGPAREAHHGLQGKLPGRRADQHTSLSTAPQRVNRRYKTQLRDFLSTCRTKRKLTHVDNGLTTYMGHSGNFHQTLYPAAAALDNRFLAATTENIFHQYRPLGTYYPDYHHAAATTPYVSNGFLDMSPRATTCIVDTSRSYVVATNIGNTGDMTTHNKIVVTGGKTTSKHSPSMDGMSSSNSAGSSPAATTANGLITPKLEDIKTEVVQAATLPHHYSPPAAATDTPRQTVLMWGMNSNPGTPVVTTMSNGTPTPYGTHPDASPVNKKYNSNDPLKSLAEMNSVSVDCKWSGGSIAKPEPVSSASPTHPVGSPAKSSYHHHHQHHQVVASHHHHHHHQHQHSGGLAYSETGAGSEVWPVHHQYHQYYPYTTPYHHHAPHTPVSDNAYPQISRTGVLCCPSLR